MESTTSASSSFKTGFARELITPPRGVPLAGYFDPRYNVGVLDELYVRVLLLQAGSTVTGIISLDLIQTSDRLLTAIGSALREAGIAFAEDLLIAATHTHTGPNVGGLFYETPADFDEYIRIVAQKTVIAVRRAQANLYTSTLECGSVINNPFAFNRRYLMKDGSVVTNPGKLNPDIVRPEGTVDREIGILLVRQEGEPTGLLLNIVNHCDTTGGDRVSADWPGHLEDYVQERLGFNLPVITLVGASGNINHFDIHSEDPQASYEEARRIGHGYGQIVCGQLQALTQIPTGEVRTDSLTVTLPYRQLSESELAEARKALAETEVIDMEITKPLTSEDLAQRNPRTLRFFAKQYLEFDKKTRGTARDFRMAAIKIDDTLGIVTLPCEPFTEIGLRIKEQSPFSRTFVVSLANGSAGYIPLEECFPRGGYETYPRVGGGVCEEGAEILIEHAVKLLCMS